MKSIKKFSDFEDIFSIARFIKERENKDVLIKEYEISKSQEDIENIAINLEKILKRFSI